MITIVTVYDQKARETEERPARRLNWHEVIRQGGGGTVQVESSTPTANTGTQGAQNVGKPHTGKNL